ncbi:hypothetical protein P3L10_011584 [Capsicum annuum]
MDKLRNLATKGVKIFCHGSGSGSKKRITSGRGNSSSRYTRVPLPPVLLGIPFEEEIGVGAHDMDYVEDQENYGIEEENEVDAVNLDEDNENIAETPTVGDANDMDYVDDQENYGIEEENEVDTVNLDEDNENIAETPTVGDANVRSESINLPPRPLNAPRPRKELVLHDI